MTSPTPPTEGLTTLTPERVRELLWEHQGRATGQKFAPYSTLLVGEFFALCDAWLAAQGREEWPIRTDRDPPEGGNTDWVLAWTDWEGAWFQRSAEVVREYPNTWTHWLPWPKKRPVAPAAPIPREGEPT